MKNYMIVYVSELSSYLRFYKFMLIILRTMIILAREKVIFVKFLSWHQKRNQLTIEI